MISIPLTPSMSGCNSLGIADVKIIQPPVVQDDELHPSLLSPKKAVFDGVELHPLAISPAFQELINRLLQQHLVEMSSVMDSMLQLRQATQGKLRGVCECHFVTYLIYFNLVCP